MRRKPYGNRDLGSFKVDVQDFGGMVVETLFLGGRADFALVPSQLR
jgi:hypothetical protein